MHRWGLLPGQSPARQTGDPTLRSGQPAAASLPESAPLLSHWALIRRRSGGSVASERLIFLFFLKKNCFLVGVNCVASSVGTFWGRPYFFSHSTSQFNASVTSQSHCSDHGRGDT